jgi:oligopeptide transport system permease protein
MKAMDRSRAPRANGGNAATAASELRDGPNGDGRSASRSAGFWSTALIRLAKNKMAMGGGIVVLVLACVAIFAPEIAPHGYAAGRLEDSFTHPSSEFLFGADALGRDVLSRLIYGTRISLTVGIVGALTAFIIGVTYGTISGFAGGRVDNIMMRFVDVMFGFPDLLFIILLMVLFKNVGDVQFKSPFMVSVVAVNNAFGGLLFIMIGIGFTSWVGMARMARGMALSLRNTEYVEAARALGAGNARLIFKHIIPNLMGPCVVRVTLAIPGFIATEAFLSFIGLGANPPTPSWGLMISDGYQVMLSHPYLAIVPGLALAVTMIAFNFLGDGLRDAIDPRMAR